MSTGSNINNHVIDDAVTVKVNLDTTAFTNAEDLQSCLEEIDPHALSPLPTTPQATESVTGIIKISTELETLDDLNDSTAITPAKMKYWFDNQGVATESTHGIIKVASNTDMSNPAEDSKAVTVSGLEFYANNIRLASETDSGFARFATNSEALLGTSNDVVMTPLRTVEAITQWASGTDSDATTIAKGLIRIATPAEANNDANDNLALTPFNLNSREATTTKRGAFYIPTSGVASARTSNDHAITPGTLNLFQATSSLAGVSKLVNNLTSTATDAALTAAMGKQLQDEKIGASGGTITGTLKVNEIETTSNDDIMVNGKFTSEALINMYPIGAIYMSVTDDDPSSTFGGTWVAEAQGRVIIGVGNATDTNGETRTFQSGSTGGEFEHQLTESEMPEHKHAGWGENRATGLKNWGYASQYGRSNIGSGSTDYDNYLWYSEPKGGDQPHNNMQPYLVVYIWRRTA